MARADRWGTPYWSKSILLALLGCEIGVMFFWNPSWRLSDWALHSLVFFLTGAWCWGWGWIGSDKHHGITDEEL